MPSRANSSRIASACPGMGPSSKTSATRRSAWVVWATEIESVASMQKQRRNQHIGMRGFGYDARPVEQRQRGVRMIGVGLLWARRGHTPWRVRSCRFRLGERTMRDYVRVGREDHVFVMRLILRSLGCVIAIAAIDAAAQPASPRNFGEGPQAVATVAALSRIRVDGNRLVDEQGGTVVFRGAGLSDPARLKQRGQWGRRYPEQARKWNANLVRFPVHPAAWRALGADKYLELLDEGVMWASELGMYVI